MYGIIFKSPTCSWQEGVLLIMKAFNNLPPNFNTWDIRWWKVLVKQSEEIIKARSSSGTN